MRGRWALRWLLAGALGVLAWTGWADVEPLAVDVRAGQLAPVTTPRGALGQAAHARGLSMGVAVRGDALTRATYRAAVTDHFSAVTPENALKLREHWSVRGFDWTEADAIADLARRSSQGVRVHPLVWDHADGLFPAYEAMSQEACRDALRRHITDTVTRYADQLIAVDVVNEPLNAQGVVAMGRWARCLGDDPVDFAFTAAAEARRRVGSVAALAVNETGALVRNEKSDGLFALVSGMRARGVQVDEVGLQAHVSIGHPPDPRSMRANLRRFTDAGIPVQITELDVSLDVPGLSRDEALARQARVAADVVAACLDAGPRCRGVTIWGASDDQSWLVRGVPGSRDAPVLFDERGTPKPAYASLIDALQPPAVARAGDGRRRGR